MFMFVCVFDCFAMTSAFSCTVAVSCYFLSLFLSGGFLISVTIIIAMLVLFHYFIVFSFGNFRGMLCTTKKRKD